MYNNAKFKTKGEVKGYRTRSTEGESYLSDHNEIIHLFDCNFTADGWGIFATTWGYMWFRREDVEYISGNVGVRAGDKGISE